MITVIAEFRLPRPMTAAQAREVLAFNHAADASARTGAAVMLGV